MKSKLAEIFEGLDAEAFLVDVIGAQNLMPNGSEIIHSCKLPFGMHKNGDSNPSASLNRDTLLFNCFTCGGGSIIWLTENVLQVSRDQAIVELKNYSHGVEVVPVEKFLEKLNNMFKSEGARNVDIPVYNKNILKMWEIGPTEYFDSRGVSREVQREMNTGLQSQKLEKTHQGRVIPVDRVVIPHFVNGRLVGWVCRRLDDSLDVAKYKNSKGFPKQYTLFNWDVAKEFESVYVVESPMSVLVLKSRGIDNVVSTFGAKVTSSQMELLRKFSEVVIFMDGDNPGRAARTNLINGLRDYTRVRVIETPDGEDPASLPEIPNSLSAFEYLITT